MPAGLEVTVPLPDFATVRAYCGVEGGEGVVGGAAEVWNVAVTERAALIGTVQVLLVPHDTPDPDQPTNVWPAAGVSVRVTLVPSA